jgi:hypothetical protein
MLKFASVAVVWFVTGALTIAAWEAVKFEQDQHETQGRGYHAVNPITEESRYVVE